MTESNARPAPQKKDARGAEARFSFDRMAIERFQQTFPRARWSDERSSWFVPGKTAARRIDRWLAQEAALRAPHDIARDAMPSPSTQYRASIWRSRTTSAFAPLIRGPCLKNCALFRGRVGTMSCGLGEFRSAHMKSYGADGQASKKLRSMPNRRRGNGDEQPPGTPKHIKPHKSGLLNAGAIAIRCQLKIYLLWAALSQPSSTGLSSSLKFPVNWLSYPTQPPSTPAQCLRTATSFGAGGVRLRWPNL